MHDPRWLRVNGLPGTPPSLNYRARTSLKKCAHSHYDRLEERRFNARHHVRKILALAEIYPVDLVARAISDGLAFEAFSAEYITDILETRARALPEPGPLQLTAATISSTSISIPPILTTTR